MNSFTSHVLSPSLTVASGEYGLSVTAAQPIPTGQRLVHVPAALAITADRALRSPTLAALLSRDTEAHISIAAWLMLHTTAMNSFFLHLAAFAASLLSLGAALYLVASRESRSAAAATRPRTSWPALHCMQ